MSTRGGGTIEDRQRARDADLAAIAPTVSVKHDGLATLSWLTGPTFTDTDEEDVTPNAAAVARAFGAAPGDQVTIRSVWAPNQRVDEGLQAVEVEVVSRGGTHTLSWVINPGDTAANRSGSAAEEHEFHVDLQTASADPGHTQALIGSFDRAAAGLWDRGIENFELPAEGNFGAPGENALLDHLGMDGNDDFDIRDYLYGG